MRSQLRAEPVGPTSKSSDAALVRTCVMCLPGGSQPNMAYGTSGLNRCGAVAGLWRVAGGSGRPAPRGNAPRPIATTAPAAASTGTPLAIAVNSHRSLVRPLRIASPTSIRAGGTSPRTSSCSPARAVTSSTDDTPCDVLAGPRAGWGIALVRAGAGLQQLAQRPQALRGLALDGAGRAAKYARRLLGAQVAVKPQYQRRPLPRREGGQCRAQVERAVMIGALPRHIERLLAQDHPLRPARLLFAEELPHEHDASVGVDVISGPHQGPADVELGDGTLHQVIGTAPVLAEQVRYPPPGGHPARHVLGELGVPPSL